MHNFTPRSCCKNENNVLVYIDGTASPLSLSRRQPGIGTFGMVVVRLVATTVVLNGKLFDNDRPK